MKPLIVHEAAEEELSQEVAFYEGEAKGLGMDFLSEVEVAFRRPSGAVESERIALRGTSEAARTRFVTTLLDRLRRKLALIAARS